MKLYYLDNNTYRISDTDAGRLAKTVNKQLPKHGTEMEVILPNTRLAWLTRTPYTRGNSKRNWVWSVCPKGNMSIGDLIENSDGSFSLFETKLDMTARYAPTLVCVRGINALVTEYIAHPKGQHPDNCPLTSDCVALECKTIRGSRWYGVEEAWINAELKMVIRGTHRNNTVQMRWRECKIV